MTKEERAAKRKEIQESPTINAIGWIVGIAVALMFAVSCKDTKDNWQSEREAIHTKQMQGVKQVQRDMGQK